jgi:hypothetical protein
VNFGNGLCCVGGSLERLFVHVASGGIVSAPQPGDPSVSVRSVALGAEIPTGATRFYQTYYRDPNPSFCPAPLGDTWNVSSSLAIVWSPGQGWMCGPCDLWIALRGRPSHPCLLDLSR